MGVNGNRWFWLVCGWDRAVPQDHLLIPNYSALWLTNRCQILEGGRAEAAAFAEATRDKHHRQRGKSASRPISRVLYGPCPQAETWRPFFLGGHCCTPHATYPDDKAGNCPEGCPSRHPYSVLLPAGFAVPTLLPGSRWALTPPFHPCPASQAADGAVAWQAGRFAFCGTFPGVAPAGR